MTGVQRFMWWTAGEWEALGTWATVLVAAVATGFALRQLNETKRARVEASAAYVAIYMESTEANPQLVDLVVRNFGATAASDIRIASDVTLRRTSGDSGAPPEDVWLPTTIPTLAPGQEWRTLWDFSPTRSSSDLEERHEVTINFKTYDGTGHSATYVLDWGAYLGRRWVDIKNMHDLARSVAKIEKTTSRWSESIHGSLSVFVRDGDERDRRCREEYEAATAEARELRRAQEAAEPEDPNEFDTPYPGEPTPGAESA